jgi:hypothetical protein
MANRLLTLNDYLGTDYVGTDYVSTALAVQLTVPRYPYGMITKKRQTGDFSLGGGFYSYDRSTLTRVWSVTFPRISSVVLDQIFSFFDGRVRGGVGFFTWEDHAGATHLVRLLGDIGCIPTNNGLFAVSFTFEEPITDESIFPDWPYLGSDYVGTNYVQV